MNIRKIFSFILVVLFIFSFSNVYAFDQITIDNNSYECKLKKLIEFAECLNQDDYEVYDWKKFKATLDKAKLSNLKDYKLNYTKLNKAINSLEYNLRDKIVYDFEDNISPFKEIYGNKVIDETNISSLGEKGYQISTEKIDDTNKVKCMYTFAHKLDDKVISFWFRDFKNAPSDMIFAIGNEQNCIGVQCLKPENGTGWYYTYEKINGVLQQKKNTGIRRLADWHKLEWNFTIDDGVSIYMDGRLLFESKYTKNFNTISIAYENSDEHFVVIDDFSIKAKNPITSIIIPDEKVILGYYDTYQISPSTIKTTTEKDYETTDKLMYSGEDDNIIFVTKGGSIEGRSTGTTYAKVTSSSGVSDNVLVEVKDIKVKGIKISDSSIYCEPNKVTNIVLKQGERHILNAILTPTGVTNRNVEWNSDNEEIVTIKDGLVTGLTEGKATITAKTKDGEYKAKCVVTVYNEEIEYGKEIFVSKSGDDNLGDGSIDNPFLTIEKARDTIRNLDNLPDGGVVVYIREGVYSINEGIVFEEQDSGFLNKPIKYTAYNNENVIFRGSVDLDSREFKKVPDSNDMKKRIKDSAKENVYVLNLKKYGINTYKPLQYYGHSMGNLPWVREEGKNVDNPYYSLIFNNNEMNLARWPNNDKTQVVEVIHEGAVPRYWKDDIKGRPDWVPEAQRDKEDVFEITCTATNEQLNRWRKSINPLDNGAWIIGYWANEFSDQSIPIREITENGSIISDEPSAYGVKKNQPFYVYNLIEELDSPGEWYLDQSNNDLYFYPPENTDMTENNLIQIPVLNETMFTFNNTNYIQIDNIDMQVMQKKAVQINGGQNNLISHCKIEGTRKRAGDINDYIVNGKVISRAVNNGFAYCYFHEVNGGVGLSGGNLNTLNKGLNYVEGCKFETFATVTKTYNPAVALSGVGNRVSFCEITDGPHNAIIFNGNDHLIEFSDLHHVVLEAGDQAAIYTGRNIIQRGTMIRNNYFHDIGNQHNKVQNSAVYFDDLSSGHFVIDNVFENVHWGVFVNGGRDNTIVGNTFINMENAGITKTNWGYTGVNNFNIHGNGTRKDPITLKTVTIDWYSEDSPYSKYPNLQNVLRDRPCEGKYNKAIDNKAVNMGDKDLIKVLDRKVGNNAKEILDDWYYEKNNIYIQSN